MEIISREHKGFVYYSVSYDINHDKKMMDIFETKAKELANNVNPADPSGQVRTPDVLYTKALGGIIAEHSVRALIEYTAKKYKINVEFQELSFSNSLEQLDLVLKVGGKIKKIEIRSSFSYKTSFERIFEGAFSIIGPYITQTKGRELEKDFYIFVLHFYAPTLLEHGIKSDIMCYVIGGASIETLKKIGTIASLKQGSMTKYRTIKPIINATDANQLLADILEVKYEKEKK